MQFRCLLRSDGQQATGAHARFALLIGAVLAANPGLAQKTADHMDNGMKQLTLSTDTRFVMNAAQGAVAEIQLGQLVAEKATDPDVKAFAQKMVDDHTKLNNQLKSIADKEGMTLPTTMNARDQALYDKLKGQSGAQLEKTYMGAMVKDHAEDIKEFNREANKGKDARLKQFAQSAVPILQQHLASAETTEAKTKSGGS